jgi:hypothetical protein
MARRQMPMAGTIVLMRYPEFDTDEVEPAVSHASFRNDHLAELPYFIGGTLQCDRFQALLMIQMHMHGGHRQVMVSMMQCCQSL